MVHSLISMLFICLFAASAHADFADYKKLGHKNAGSAKVGKTYRVLLDDLRPTQFSVAFEEIFYRKNKLESMSKKERREYLEKKVGELILGPDGTLWLVDGHHLAKALLALNKKRILLELKHDWSAYSLEGFFNRMQRYHKVWLYDHEGRRRSVAELPQKMEDLKNDPYRALAWRVEKAGGFSESEIPFQEFRWANFFRRHISKRELSRSREKSFQKAFRLSRSSKARHLPGYRRLGAISCSEHLI